MKLRGFFFAVFPWEANFRCFSPRQVKLCWFIQSDMSEAVFHNHQNNRNSSETDVAIRSMLVDNVVISTSISLYSTVYVDWLDLAAKAWPFYLHTAAGVVTLNGYICLGNRAGLMRWVLTIWSCWAVKSCYYDYSQYLSFQKEVERTALICDHF